MQWLNWPRIPNEFKHHDAFIAGKEHYETHLGKNPEVPIILADKDLNIKTTAQLRKLTNLKLDEHFSHFG
ncbi:MAG: hypothetical protein M1812_003693 [Candelaria pacifica]|nr:MAG: hypothetical protein M1812_003693 [Candelaria pacifica]